MLAETGGDPLALSGMAAPAAHPARLPGIARRPSCASAAAGRLLLPRLEPLGDIDDEELLLAGDGEAGTTGESSLDLPPAVAPLRRQLLLSRAILAARHNFAAKPFGLDQAARLATSSPGCSTR